MPSHVGLDIGSSAVRAVHLKGGTRRSRIHRMGQVMLPDGAVRDGTIRDADAVGAALRELWASHRIRERRVAIGVSSPDVIVRAVELPDLPDDELAGAVRLQAEEWLPIDADVALMDHVPFADTVDAEGVRHRRVLLVAVHRRAVDEMVELVTRAGLEPVAVDLDAFAALRALAPGDAIEAEDAEMLVDVGASLTSVVVHVGGRPHFARLLLTGGDAVTTALVDELGDDRRAAERWKAGTDPATIDPEDDAARERARVVTEAADDLVDEIRESLHYHQSQTGAVTVGHVVVTGGGALLPRFADRVGQALDLPLVERDVFAGMDTGKLGLPPERLAEAAPYMAVALGLAMDLAA